MLIPESEQRDLLVYAFRYALGRATYAPHTIIAVLKQCWPELKQIDRELYHREIKEAIERNIAGHEHAKRAWLEILRLSSEPPPTSKGIEY